VASFCDGYFSVAIERGGRGTQRYGIQMKANFEFSGKTTSAVE